MKHKETYTAPACMPIAVWESQVLCASTTLDPIEDNTDIIVWGSSMDPIF